jgi:hypothetical protein
MGIKALAAKALAKYVIAARNRQYSNPVKLQLETLQSLLGAARNTGFGKEHHFSELHSPEEYRQAVPVRDYEQFKPYLERLLLKGENNVLWPGRPLYLCKSSGTTSGVKLIPLSRESMPNHIQSARNALLSYIHDSGKASFVDGKMIFLQGSPVLDPHYPSGIPMGRLSGIVANHVPAYLQKNRMPSFAVNSVEDWESKVDAIVEETLQKDMRLISGIPAWVQMYFEKLLLRSGKATIREVFPNFSLFVYGGVNFDPYRPKFRTLIGGDVPSVEVYPASEGFIAYQDSQREEGMLLVLNGGIYFEFIPTSQLFEANPPRLNIGEVKTGQNYAILLTTNAGLWSYLIGDTVKFVSLSPPRIIVSGRISHYTSAFGEHVIAEEVERAMKKAMDVCPAEINEFTVAPQVQPVEGLPYHEWLVEFSKPPENLELFAASLDRFMQEQNIYYRDLIKGKVLRPLVLRPLSCGAFNAYMASVGKLGGQNKTPRLSNDRKIAEFLLREFSA